VTTLIQDVRYGLRILVKSPGFTAVAVLTLALGIGANTAMFSVINTVLLRPLPFRDPGRLVAIDGIPALKFNGLHDRIVGWEDWVSKTRTLEALGTYVQGGLNFSGGDEPERLPAAAVSAGFFELLGVGPIRGRTILPQDDAPGHAVAVISYDLWLSHLGGDPQVVGKNIELGDMPFKVTGVMPPGFEFPGDTQVWVPEAMNRGANLFAEAGIVNRQIARLRAGVTLTQARAELLVFLRQLNQGNASPFNPALSVTPLQLALAQNIRPALLVLMGAVGLVLLIACADVANLLLARTLARYREVAVRAAIGASRARLVGQLLTESILLAISGGLAALLVGVWGVELAGAFVPHRDLPAGGIRLDGWVLAFTLGVALLTGILAGLFPALASSKVGLSEALKEGAGGSPSGFSFVRHRRLRTALGAGEIALALMLLIGAGLLIKSLSALSAVNPGFRSNHLLTARLFLAAPVYKTAERRSAFYEQALDRARSLVGVRVAGFVSSLPLGEGVSVMFSIGIEGSATPKAETSDKWAVFVAASPDYFRAMGIPLLAGRVFNEHDREGSPQVVVVSQKMAREFWPGQDPLGMQITQYDPPRWTTVIGVVGDVRDWDLSEQPEPEMYVPVLQQPPLSAFLVLQTSGPVSLTEIGRAVRAVDRAEPVSAVNTGEQLLARATATPRFRAVVLAIFAGLALLLAVVGIYGVISYAANQRRHEIGVRMALGAEQRDVLVMVLGQGLRLALIGIMVGLAGALALTRLLAGFLYGVRPTDLAVFALVSMGLTVVTLIVVSIPAWRAMKVDPMVALRYE